MKNQLFLLLLLFAVVCTGFSQSFQHPGLLSTRADLDLVRDNQTIEPWRSALAALKASYHGSLNYSMQGPYEQVWRESGNRTGWSQHGNDATACYVQSVLWYITGDTRYATKAKNIINAWSGKLQSINGADVELLAGWHGPLWAMAGEILAYTDAGWSGADITRAKNMLTNVFLPPMVGFAEADGANFSTSCIFSTMAIAVFTDNRTKFDEAWAAFTSTSGCPNDFSLLRNIAPNGQNVESGRDQVHSWSSYEALAAAAEIAYNQGKDPYSLGSNRLMQGAEYWCKYNLGNEVPYDQSVYRCRRGWGPWGVISSVNRGIPTNQGATCNMMYRAYKRMGLESAYTKQMADEMGNTLCPPNPRNGWSAPFITDALLFNLPPGGSEDISSYDYCSKEEETCTFNERVDIAYGAKGQFNYQYNVSGNSIGCNNATFGDPVPGTQKACYVRPAAGSLPNGTYKIIARHSGKALEVANNGAANGSNVQQWPENNCNCQLWTITDQGNGEYAIVGVGSGKNLDISSASLENGGNVQIWSSNGKVNQRFRITAIEGDYYRIVAVHSGKVLDVSGMSSADGANIHQWTYVGGTNQQWLLKTQTGTSTRIADAEQKELALLEEESLSEDIAVYPNPTSEKLTIHLSKEYAKNTEILLRDLSGKVVLSKKVNGSEHILDLSNVPSGAFILILTSEREEVFKKVIKK